MLATRWGEAVTATAITLSDKSSTIRANRIKTMVKAVAKTAMATTQDQCSANRANKANTLTAKIGFRRKWRNPIYIKVARESVSLLLDEDCVALGRKRDGSIGRERQCRTAHARGDGAAVNSYSEKTAARRAAVTVMYYFASRRVVRGGMLRYTLVRLELVIVRSRLTLRERSLNECEKSHV